MEDFSSRLRNLKCEFDRKKIIKAILLFFIFILVLIFLVKLIIFIFFKKENIENIDTVVLIRADNETIKIIPDDRGGLNIDNLDINVYDLVDQTTKNESGDINIKESENAGDDFSIGRNQLNEKIDELMKGETTSDKSDADIEIVEDVLIEEGNGNATNINQNIVSSKNLEGLNKLGNRALIDNIKNHKDIKPGIKVQLLALKSQDLLIKYWDELLTKYSNLFSNKTYYIEKSNIKNSGIIYRLQVGNFDSYENADNFCSEFIKVSNKTKVDCITIKN